MTLPPLSDDAFETLAAEHVLGLLDDADAARAEMLAQTDDAFIAAIERWRLRFAELDVTAPPHPPSPDLLARISATLDDAVPQTAPQAAEPQAAEPQAAPHTAAKPRASVGRGATPGWIERLWESLGFWRVTGFAGAAATLLLAIGIAFGPFARTPQPQMVAVLMGPQGEPAAVVNAFADGTADLIPLRSISVPEGRVLEVWTLWDPARGPVSIGLTGESRRIRLDLKNLPRTAPNQLFEITLEPQGGSPIGRPTGPILMKGTTSVAL